ncbi:MAG: Na(+)/H(+) antiporter subunit A [Chloroflexi bacterium]|nr:Na(+)/H(+) antiporter subunit A [Chloroflexota bacterium]
MPLSPPHNHTSAQDLGVRPLSRVLFLLAPLALFGFFVAQAGRVAAGQPLELVWRWVPSLGVSFALRLDGLSLLFALIITGIGALIVLCSSFYLTDRGDHTRFQILTLLFMAAMVGVVVADDLITLFVFWELTSITSFLLIGFRHDEERARYGALKALIITAGGGLVMLLGLLLGQMGQGLRVSELLLQGEALRAHPLYAPALLMILVGAFSKSAQAPFHTWLPDAMEAPTPASAYLHSATMVKAGVYLLARLQPALGGTDLWVTVVGITGLATMVLGAFIAFSRKDLKAMLAYSTVSSLGMFTALIGLGSTVALKAALATLLAHALYKSALFLVAGSVDHGAGTRDIRRLGQLGSAMPLTAAFATLAALSYGGLPPTLGFVGKELALEAAVEARLRQPYLWALPLASAFTFGLGIVLTWSVFWDRRRPATPHAHEGPWGMWLPPALLALLSLALGAGLGSRGLSALLSAATSAASGQAVTVKLALWHGLNVPMLLSLGSITVGAVIYLTRGALWRWQDRWPAQMNMDTAYRGALDLLNRAAQGLTRRVQSGALRNTCSSS